MPMMDPAMMAPPVGGMYPSTQADQLAQVIQAALEEAFGADHAQLEADQQSALPQAMALIHPFAQALMAGPPADPMRAFGEGGGPVSLPDADLGMAAY
jgi:hypothetical protein